MIKEYFFVDEIPDGYYMIKVNTELINLKGARGSLNVIPARVCGLAYAEYLRYCRSEFGAELRGKKGYPYPVFKNKSNAQKLSKQLSERFNALIVI